MYVFLLAAAAPHPSLMKKMAPCVYVFYVLVMCVGVRDERSRRILGKRIDSNSIDDEDRTTEGQVFTIQPKGFG